MLRFARSRLGLLGNTVAKWAFLILANSDDRAHIGPDKPEIALVSQAR